MGGHACGNGHCLKTLNEQHRQLAKLYGSLSMSDENEMELFAECHRATGVKLTTALGFCSMTSSNESLECLECAHELAPTLTGPNLEAPTIGSWREAAENEMNLKHSEGYQKTYLKSARSIWWDLARHHIAIVNTERIW